MQLGISSYCLDRDIAKGVLTLMEAIDWAAKHGAQIMELVPFSFRFDDPETGKIDTQLIQQVKQRAKDAGIQLVNYSVLANLLKEGQEQEDEIARVCHEVDIAAELGLTRMRHDISSFRRPQNQNSLQEFDRLLPTMVEATQRISEHGRTRGVKTLIENHGFFVNGCDRVERVLSGVNSDNYGLLLDTGNVICVDEDPSAAAVLLAHKCDMVHLKDFYVRHQDPGDSTMFDCGGSWFRSRGGKYLRGSILAQGDLDVPGIVGALKHAGYQGPIGIEFEGLEDARYATAVSLQNARRHWEQA